MVINVSKEGRYHDGTGTMFTLKQGQQTVADEAAKRLAKEHPEEITLTGNAEPEAPQGETPQPGQAGGDQDVLS